MIEAMSATGLAMLQRWRRDANGGVMEPTDLISFKFAHSSSVKEPSALIRQRQVNIVAFASQ
jgi:hypothetical protein